MLPGDEVAMVDLSPFRAYPSRLESSRLENGERIAMISIPRRVHSVGELMEDGDIGFRELVALTGIDKDVVAAIVHQRYTPSPNQRDRVSAAFGVARAQIKWGHAITPEPHMHAPD